MSLRKGSLIALCSAMLVFVLVLPPALLAQQNSVVLSLTVAEWMTDALDAELFSEFEAQHPGVTINAVKSSERMFYPSAATSIEEHLDGAAEYVASADVLYVSATNLSVETTQAGYFLDLAPLVNTDPSLNVEDFIPAVWHSVQWDRGVWALPVAADLLLVVYEPAAFDRAGLQYPNEFWTMDDFANAARELASRDEEGNVTSPGFVVSSGIEAVFFRALVGAGFYDGSALPATPHLTDPALENVLATWTELREEGVVANAASDDVPLRIDNSFAFSELANTDEHTYAGALLPGGIAALTTQGFAVSAGTQYPQEAYELAKFLTMKAEVAGFLFSATPARRSLVGLEAEDGPGFTLNYSPEAEAVVAQAIERGLPTPEFRFADYVALALERMLNQGLDAHQALQQVETEAIANLQTAGERRTTATVMVATPVPTPVLTTGEVTLKFNMTAFAVPFPNRDEWDQVLKDFIASDPRVGRIIFETGFGVSLEEAVEQYDCFYMPFNLVAGESNLTGLTNLDPFMDADPAFDRGDVLGSTMAQLQRDNKTWAYPVVIQPQVLNYHREQFNDAGVPLPEAGWTVSDFNDALLAIKVNPDDPAPFTSRSIGGTHLLMLIAAYGGLPLDYRTDPVTIDLTSPANVDAIRQVLNLAKDGYIEYQELSGFNFFGAGGGSDSAIYSTMLSTFSFNFGGGDEDEDEEAYAITGYPQGTQFSAASYDIGTAYISANAQNPEACYRWISAMAQHPQLFSAMPARLSHIAGSVITGGLGDDVTAFYEGYAALLQAPNTIVLPSLFSGGGSVGTFLMQFWLFRAFDRYVLEDADLDAELGEAQVFITAFQECIVDIPPFDPGQDQIEYFTQYTDCASRVDPSLESLFDFLGD